jgi:hypothetical protein
MEFPFLPCLPRPPRLPYFAREAHMGKINLSRVVVGGLLAGLVINVGEFLLNGVVFASQMAAAMSARNLPMVGPQTISAFMVMGFALGIATVWVYAAIRPRFGPGVPTAVVAGAIVWFLAYLYPGIGMVIMGIFPGQLMAIGLVWGIAEVVLGAVVGAWAYSESDVPTMVRA